MRHRTDERRRIALHKAIGALVELRKLGVERALRQSDETHFRRLGVPFNADHAAKSKSRLADAFSDLLEAVEDEAMTAAKNLLDDSQ